MSQLPLDAVLAEYTGAFNAFLTEHALPWLRERSVPALAGPMVYSLDAPGKRLRPTLCLLAAGVDPAARPFAPAYYAAAALECIHTYSLIHDDLPAMDDDDLRRGRPACHRAYSEWAAILAGDALNTYAFELLARPYASGSDAAASTLPNLADLVRILAEASGPAGMVGGQTLDVENEKTGSGARLDESARRRLLEQIHLWKTAALIRAACELGACFAGQADRSAMRAWGERLGLLFQIADDLIDATGDERIAGKAVGKDAALGKLTYPGVYGLSATRGLAEEYCLKLEAESETLAPGPRAVVDARSVWKRLPRYVLERQS